MVLKRLALVLIFSALALTLSAQVDEGMEQWVEETGDEEAAAGMSDALAELAVRPVNINDTLALDRLPLLSPFQRRALGNYIMLYGPLLSLEELRFVPGFDSATVAWLRPLVVVATRDTMCWRLSDGRHTVLATVGGALERAAGYDNGAYEGDPLRTMLLYTYDLHGRLNIRLVGEKDATEAWGRSNYYAYHVMLNDIGVLDRLVAGRFNLQFGQGLTLWTGLRPFTFMGNGTVRYGHGVRQAVTMYEEDYQEGVAARLRLSRHFKVSAFASHALGERLAGTHVDFRTGNLMLGATASWIALDSIPAGRDYAYNQLRFSGQRQFNAGVDAMWQSGPLMLYGEVAVGENGAPAAVGGMRLAAGSAGRLSLGGRYMHPHYHNLHAQPYAVSTAQGEQGMTLEGESRMPFGMVLTGSLDMHRYPALRYGSYMPSGGAWLRVQLRRQWGEEWNAAVRYSLRQKERNIPNLDTQLYVGENTMREQWQAELRYTMGAWQLVGRAVYARFDASAGTDEQGLAAGLQARYRRGSMSFTLAGAWFDVDGYYARIYYNESNLQYAWSMPAFYGRGGRIYAVVRWSPTARLTLAAKYALTYMPGQVTIGSGNSATEGPLRQQCTVQVRWNF